MAFNGMSVHDLLHRGRYYVRWVTDYGQHTDWNIQVIGWALYDTKQGKEVFEHEDRHVVESMFKLLRDEGT